MMPLKRGRPTNKPEDLEKKVKRLEMEKVLKKMPGAEDGAPHANLVLEINSEHKISEKLKSLYVNDRDTLTKYAKILYSEACLISGVAIENPAELAALISELMV